MLLFHKLQHFRGREGHFHFSFLHPIEEAKKPAQTAKTESDCWIGKRSFYERGFMCRLARTCWDFSCPRENKQHLPYTQAHKQQSDNLCIWKHKRLKLRQRGFQFLKPSWISRQQMHSFLESDFLLLIGQHKEAIFNSESFYLLAVSRMH